MTLAEQQRVARTKLNYPPGTRIELIQMGDDPRPVAPGTRGEVSCVDDMGSIHMHWDNGRTLALIPGEDSFRKLTPEEIALAETATAATESIQRETGDEGFSLENILINIMKFTRIYFVTSRTLLLRPLTL